VIAGHVTDDGVPVINIQFAGREWTAIVDTGFNGELELPRALQQHVNAQIVGRVFSLLAGGHRIEEDAYLVDFQFDGQTVCVQATFADSSEILLGTRLLHGHRLEIDFRTGTVLIDAS